MKKQIIKYILIFLLILSFNMIVYPLLLDEIWAYGFSYGIFNGLVPYRDYNMVITPFHPFFMSIFLFIYNNILTLHIVNATIMTYIFHIIEKMYKEKAYYLLLLYFVPIPIAMLNYNNFLLVFLILIIYLEKSKIKNKDLLIGILIALSFLSKQSVGIFYIIPSIIFFKKVDLKKRIVGFLIPNLILLIYLLLTNSLYNFIDLCFLGLLDFTNNTHGFNPMIILFIILIGICIIIIKKHPKDMLGYYALCIFPVFLPILDSYHFMYCLFMTLMLYLEYYNIKARPKMLFVLSMFFIIFGGLINDINFKSEYPNNIKHFEYMFIPQGDIDEINKVSKFVREHKTIIFDEDSYLYRIMNDQKIEYLDLVNHGNYGYNGAKKIIKDLKKKKDYYVLIDRRDKKQIDKHQIQLEKEGYYYILNNYKKVKQIGKYDIYKYD